MKTRFFTSVLLIGCLLLTLSCGPGSKDYKEMPTGEDFQKVYDVVMKDKECEGFYEILGDFNIESSNMTPPTEMRITYISPKNKTNLFEYGYNMVDGKWYDPKTVTLHMDPNNRLEKPLTKEDFADALFQIEDMPAFSQFDAMYKKALQVAAMGEQSCIVGFNMNKFDGENNFYITVALKGDPNKKNIYFDKLGNVVEKEQE